MQRETPAPLSFRSILHINEKGGRFGGTEEYVDSVSHHLQGVGVRSHMLCGAVTGELPAGIHLTRLVPGLASRFLEPAAAGQVSAAVGEVDPDVVYVHNIFDARVIDALDRPGRRAAALIWYIHDHFPTCLTELRIRLGRSCSVLVGAGCLEALRRDECTRRRPERDLGEQTLAQHQALLAACGRVDATVVVSPYMRDLLVADMPDLSERIHLLPRPVRPRSPRSESPRSESPPTTTTSPKPFTVTFAGRITPEKGLDVVLEALGLLPAHQSVRLEVAGVVEHHRYWQHCQELAKAATRANPAVTFRYHGHLAYTEVDALFASSDVVVIPSKWPEPLGAVAAEALRAGATVLASRVGGLGTYIKDGETGLLLDPADVAGWAAALQTIADHPDRARSMGVAGAAAVAGLTAEAHVAALDDVIRRIRRQRPDTGSLQTIPAKPAS